MHYTVHSEMFSGAIKDNVVFFFQNLVTKQSFFAARIFFLDTRLFSCYKKDIFLQGNKILVSRKKKVPTSKKKEKKHFWASEIMFVGVIRSSNSGMARVRIILCV